jgi:anthranilate/para-aminobenzoate synthase component II
MAARILVLDNYDSFVFNLVQYLGELGAEPLGGTPERARAFIKEEQDKWGQVIREVGIKLN